MASYVFKILYREVRGLHEAAYLLGIFALASQLLALVRDRLLAGQFGAGEVLDVYYAAFRIPDLLFVGIASLVSVYVLIPFLAERLEESPERVRDYLARLFSFFIVLISVVGVALWFLLPILAPMVFPGFSPEQQEEVILLARIILLQPILLGLSNLFAGVTQIYRKFLLYALSPILYNIGIIIGVLFLYPTLGVAGLAWGVVLGAFLHLSIQLPFIARQGLLPYFTTSIDFSEIRHILRLSLPRTLTLSVGQLLLFIFIGFASLMGTGSIAVFTFAFNLQAVPLTIIGASYSVAAFPTLARLITKGEREMFISHIATAARHIIFWSTPAIVLVIVLRAQLVRVVLGVGEFSWADTRLVAAALALFVLSLSAHGLILLLVRAYYAAGDTLKPFLLSFVSALAGLSSAIVLRNLFVEHEPFRLFMEELLRVEGIGGTEVLMLPLGYSVGMLLNAIFLLTFFARDFRSLIFYVREAVWKSAFGSLLAGGGTYLALNVLDDVFDVNTFFGLFGQGLFAGLFGLLVLFGTLYVLKSTELFEIFKAFKTRLPSGGVVPAREDVIE